MVSTPARESRELSRGRSANARRSFVVRVDQAGVDRKGSGQRSEHPTRGLRGRGAVPIPSGEAIQRRRTAGALPFPLG